MPIEIVFPLSWGPVVNLRGAKARMARNVAVVAMAAFMMFSNLGLAACPLHYTMGGDGMDFVTRGRRIRVRPDPRWALMAPAILER